MKTSLLINKAYTVRFMLIPLAAIILSLAQCRKSDLPVNADPVKFVYQTEVYPPYNYSENGFASGVSVDILEGIFKKMDIPVTRSAIIVSNWAEAYEKTKSTPGTMLFSMVRTPQRDPLFKPDYLR